MVWELFTLLTRSRDVILKPHGALTRLCFDECTVSVSAVFGVTVSFLVRFKCELIAFVELNCGPILVLCAVSMVTSTSV